MNDTERHVPEPRPVALPVAVLTALVTACGPGSVELPAGTTLVAELDSEISAATAAAGDEVTARLAGDLTAEGRILLPAGAVLRGEITAVQTADERLPSAVKIAFHTLETGQGADSVAVRITSAEARTEEDAEAPGGVGEAMGLAGTVVRGREHAPMVGGELSGAPGTGILLGTDARPARLPAGGRLELELTAPLEAVPPEGEG